MDHSGIPLEDIQKQAEDLTESPIRTYQVLSADLGNKIEQEEAGDLDSNKEEDISSEGETGGTGPYRFIRQKRHIEVSEFLFSYKSRTG